MRIPRFVVARVWNSHGDRDYLSYFNNRWGTSCTGLGRAMRFASRETALAAAAAADRLVPGFRWLVVEG